MATPRATQSRPPEAPSPRRINISRDISTSDSDYPPTRYEDLKEAAIRSSTTFVNPREAPKVKDETSIGFPMGLESILRQEPVPPLPATLAAVSGSVRKLERSGSQKKGRFEFGKGSAAAPSGAKIAISRPILQENAARNPLNKIAVIGLEEAAMAERQRRARLQGDEEVDRSRSAVHLTAISPEDGVKRAVSLKRKEVASASLGQSSVSGTLHPGDVAIALTTSAQLSPGGDETRRRSPRQSMQEPIQNQQPSPAEIARATHVSPEPSDRPLTLFEQPNIPQQPVLKPDIRPSRMLPPSPKTPPPEPTKTPLQRRPTIGLPSNPRARGLRMEPDAGEKTKTIMFLNSIEYNDPVAVQTIIKGASDRAAKPSAIPETPGTSASVVNRPRPIPRKPAESPAPSPSLTHRRSKSGGSLGRKSVLGAAPGSPTQLPPLPPPPRSATMPARPQPNDTKSMTFEEKMALLFPSPSSGTMSKRISSVPSVPLVPASYLETATSPTESGERRRSNRTTKTSVRTESVLEVDEIPPKPGKTFIDTTDEAGASWLRAFGAGSDDGRPRQVVSGKRGSSPVLPADPVRASAWTETTDDRTQDDVITNWSSMQSPEIAVGVPVFQRIGIPASVRMPGRQGARGSRGDASVTDTRNSDTLPIMLDTSTIQKTDAQTILPAEGEVLAAPERITQSQWHRRVGEECPTFSDRKNKTRSRKMPPPTPLLLNTTTKKAIAIHVEPSPLESPEHALRQIQAQLKNFEDPTRDSLQSPSQRLALLEDLEKEMGQQASHWQEIKHDMGRDSLSSIQTTSPRGKGSVRDSLTVVANPSRDSSVRLSIGADRRASRMARMKNNANARAAEMSVRDSVSPQMSTWQKRLTEAQMDYMDAQLLRSSSFNLLQLSKAQLASPTPPESDQSDQSDDEVPPLPSLPQKAVTEQPSVTQPKPAYLWTPVSKELPTSSNFLWTPAPKLTSEPDAPLPGLSVRPAARKESAPLQIQSTQLWRKPYSTANRSTTGLWRPTWASAAPPVDPARLSQAPSQKAPRSVTQRPPRRNKRVTLLPDILESPEPLPDKRGTLGIFQFPWGEKSDTASIQPRPSMFMAMPGTMTSGGPSLGRVMEPRAKQVESDEYSSSFFDDYDDEDEDDVLNSDEDGSDDGFDETTLWEIASLLKTDAIPSKNSLLPPSNSVLDDYVDELASGEEGQSSREQSIVIGLAEPRELLEEQQRDSGTVEGSTLTVPDDAPEPANSAPKPAARLGLPANPKASLISRSVFAESTAPTPPQTGRRVEPPTVQTANEQGSGGLWTPPERSENPSPSGLFVPDGNRLDYRGTDKEPAAKHLTRRPRPSEPKSLDKLASTRLWEPRGAVNPAERNWIEASENWKPALVVTLSTDLWRPSEKQNTASLQGLFVADANRSDYRRTDKEPAAKYLTRKPRPAEPKPLAKLTSTNLWRSENIAKPSERDWIRAAPKLLRLNEGITVSLWNPPKKLEAPSQQGLFALGSNRTSYRGTAEEPAAKYLDRKPRPAELKPLGQLTSTSLWVHHNTAKETERNWILSKTTRRPRRPQASLEDWRAALDEAISASRSQAKRLKRPIAGPADWEAALNEAIKLSTRAPSLPSRLAFDAAVKHPVFATTSLVTRSEWFHPAATGYTYDVAVVHPVFFGSLAITCPEEAVHPAISAYAAKKLRRQRRRQRSSSRSRSRSRSRRKEEIRVLEQQEAPPPQPAVVAGSTETTATMSRRDAIQAQIEALEQERLFAQRFAQEESSRRRMSSLSLSNAAAEPGPPLPILMADSVQDLQRHLSRQIRQSLVFGDSKRREEEEEEGIPPVPAPVPPVPVPALPSRTESRRKPKTTGTNGTETKTETERTPHLWIPPPAPDAAVASTTGLWSPQAAAGRAVRAPLAAAREDREAAARRARRRKVLQRRQRRAEILGQIAAVEAGLNPFVDFVGERLWRRRGGGASGAVMMMARERDWLHSVCLVREAAGMGKGVVLRY